MSHLLDITEPVVYGIAQTALLSEQDRRYLQPIQLLNPKFSKDGNQFCFLYGELPNDCIVGFGETPYEAMIDFYENMMK